MTEEKTVQERLEAMKRSGPAPVNSSDRDLASGAALQMRLTRMKKDTTKVRGQRLAGDKDEAYQAYLQQMDNWQERQKAQKASRMKQFEQQQTQTSGSSQQRRKAAEDYQQYMRESLADTLARPAGALDQKRTQDLYEGSDAYQAWLAYKQQADPAYQAAMKTVQEDQARGVKRTVQELSRQIDALELQIYDAKLDQMSYQQKVDAGQAPDITTMQEQLAALQARKAGAEQQSAIQTAEHRISGVDDETRGLLREYNEIPALAIQPDGRGKTTSRYKITQKLLAKGYSEDEIKRLAEYEQRLKDYENYTARMEDAQDFGQRAPVFSTLISAATAPFKALGNLESIRGVLPKGLGGYENEGLPTNVYSPLYGATHVSSGIRGGVMQDMGPTGQFLYQAGTSALDSAVNMAVSVGLMGAAGVSGEAAQGAVAETMNWVMGSQVAADSVYEGIRSGKSNARALVDGIAEGAIEGITEKYSVGEIMASMLSGEAAWKKLMRSFISEGGEEIASNWLNRLYDAAAHGKEHALRQGYEAKRKDGMSESQAFWSTVKEMAAEDALSFLAGGISGVAMAGTYEATNKVAGDFYENESRQSLRAFAEEVLQLPEATESARNAAQAVVDKINAGQTPTANEVSDFAAAAASTQPSTPATDAYDSYSKYAAERDTADAARAEEARRARDEVYKQEAAGQLTREEADQRLNALDEEAGLDEIAEANEIERAAQDGAAHMDKAAQGQAEFEAGDTEQSRQAVRQAGRSAGYSQQTQAVLLEGFEAERASGRTNAEGYISDFAKAYEYGQNGMSLAAAQKAAQGLTAQTVRAAWTAGKETAGNGRAGGEASYDGGKRNAGMDSGKPGRGVAGGAGQTGAGAQGGRSAQAGLELGNRVRAENVPQQSGRDLGIQDGSAKPSFREVPRRLYTQELTELETGLKAAGATQVHFIVGSIGRENTRAHVTRYADGMTRGTEVWIQADSSRRTAREIAQHEEFHLRAGTEQDFFYKGFMALTENLTDAQIREMADRYAEAYEGCYDEADKQAIMEEMLADAFAGINRRGAQADRFTKLVRDAVGQPSAGNQKTNGTRGLPVAQRTAESNDVKNEHKQFSMIGRGENGLKTYKSDFADSMTKSQKQAYLFDLINSVWAKKPLQLSILQNGREVPITARFDGEMNGRKFSEKMAFGNRNGTRTERLITLNLANDIWEIASEARYDNGKDGHKQTEMHDGNERWHYFANAINYEDGQYPERNGVYDFNLDVMERDDGNFVYTFHLKKRRDNAPRTFNAGVDSRNAADVNSSARSIRNTDQKSQEKFSLAEEATPQENDKAALEYFGRTYKWAETGYVLLNGARLDFSGRHEGGSGGYRSVDHRDIIDALGEDYGGGDYTGGMVRFMQEGNIRISPESGGINLAVMPTKAQMDSLSDFISKERGEVILDIDDENGNTVSSTEYPRGTHANKVLQDIRAYFSDGTLPQASSAPTVGQFRYSVDEQAKQELSEEPGSKSDTREEAEEAERKAPEVMENLTMETVPVKARNALTRVRNLTAAEIQRQMDIPYRARQEVLKPQLDGLINEYLRTGSISQESIDRSFEKAYEQGREISREFYDQYKGIKDQMRGTKITISEADKADIADFNIFRQQAFGRLRIANEGGLPIDTAYQSLREAAPELFPAGITHPADQLMKMLEVSRRIEIVERTLDEAAGPNAEEVRRWAKHDFTVSIDNMQATLQLARRYAEAQARLQERRAAGKPKTVEEVNALYKALKDQRRTYERAMSKALLTEEDQKVLSQLMRGERGVETLERMENGEAIRKVFEAKLEYSVTAARIAEWKRTIRAQRMGEAESFLKDIDKAKDKAHGIALSRETMTRNNIDVFGEQAGAAINKAYFATIRKAEAEAKRYKDKMRGRVKALELSRRTEQGNTVSEAYAVQLLGEAEDNIRMLQERPYLKERDGKTIEEWNQLVLELWKQNPKLDEAKVRKSVADFRAIYDELFQRINEVRVRNGYEPINYRSGYFPHFQAKEGSGGIAEIISRAIKTQDGAADTLLLRMGRALGIETNVEELPTTIAGRTYQFKPGIRWFGNAQTRQGFATAYDALEGFDRYIEGAAGIIYQTDNIQRLRAFASQIRYLSSDEGIREQVDEIRALEDVSEEDKQNRIDKLYESGRYQLGHYIQELDDYTNLLANKKSQLDRGVERMAGRSIYRLSKRLESRVAANMVALNPGSWLTNFGVIAQASAELRTSSVLQAMQQTLQAMKQDDGFVDASAFLTNRQNSDPLIQSVGDVISAKLSTPMEWIDMFSAQTIVRARYMENLQRGMAQQEAIDEADQFAADVMAERSKGGMPTLFESRNPITKLFTQFQLEVNNTFSYLFKDVPRRKRKEGIRALAVAIFRFVLNSWLYNELYEKIVGRRSQLDPIDLLASFGGDITGTRLNNLFDWAQDGVFTDGEPSGTMQTVKNLGVSLVQELPFVGNLADGGKLPFSSSLPNVGNILTALDSDKLDAKTKGKKVMKELANPLAYWIPPFGGGQIKKLWQGIEAYRAGGSYTADGRLQYPIYTDRPGDKASAVTRTLLFGKSATEGAQAWVENGFGALSEKGTSTYEAMRAAGVDQRTGFQLIQEISAADKTDDRTKRQVQMQMLLSSSADDTTKALAYYGLIASDSEREKMDAYIQAGMDMSDYIDFRNAASEVKSEKDADGKTVPDSKKKQIVELIDETDYSPEQKTMLYEGYNYTATGFEPWTENYKALTQAVKTGKQLKQTLHALRDKGFENKDIREAITNAFREAYLNAEREEQLRLRGYLRNAFVLTGLSDKQALGKIDGWEEDD